MKFPKIEAEDTPIPPLGLSRVTGSGDLAEVENNPLKSKFLPNNVMD